MSRGLEFVSIFCGLAKNLILGYEKLLCYIFSQTVLWSICLSSPPVTQSQDSTAPLIQTRTVKLPVQGRKGATELYSRDYHGNGSTFFCHDVKHFQEIEDEI